MQGKKICVVLPTRNEEKTIGVLIDDIRSCLLRLGHSIEAIIVVDDSNDRTRSISRQHGAEVINGGGKGLGLAMYKGLKHAVHSHKSDIILAMDADGQNDTAEIEKFLQPILNEEADLVLGSRFLSKDLVKYNYRFKNRMGIHILVAILRSLTGQPLTDSHGGLRAMIPEVAQELEMLGTHTYVQETIIDAAEKGFRIRELPSVWLQRQAGTSRVVSNIPVYVFYTLPILILRTKGHIKWLYSAGISLLCFAFLYFFYISWQTNFHFKQMFDRIPSFILIGLSIMAGIQLFFFGFILQILKDVKYQIQNH